MAYQPMQTYLPAFWLDHIIDPDNGTIIQNGTRVTASRMNNIEDGIVGAWGWLTSLQREVDRHSVYLAVDGRAVGNNGTFFDTLDDKDPHLLAFEGAKGLLTQATAAGTTTLQVSTTTGFQQWDDITITDDVQSEYVIVTAVDEVANTITVNQLQNSYKKGAVVGRSTAVRDMAAVEVRRGYYKTYSVEII